MSGRLLSGRLGFESSVIGPNEARTDSSKAEPPALTGLCGFESCSVQ